MRARGFLLALVVLTILVCATPALAQLVLQPGNYTLDWVVQYRSGTDGSLAFKTGVDQISLIRTDSLDTASPYWGLCSTPYVTLGPPYTPELSLSNAIWCLSADGTLGDASMWYALGRWTLYSSTVALVNVSQGYHGSLSTDEITAIARLVPPPPPSTIKVSITWPAAGATVRGTVWIVLWVEGTSGTANTFTLSADGQQIAARTTTARGPVSIPWTTSANGTHTITGTVRDATGNTGTTTLTVVISN